MVLSSVGTYEHIPFIILAHRAGAWLLLPKNSSLRIDLAEAGIPQWPFEDVAKIFSMSYTGYQAKQRGYPCTMRIGLEW